MPIKYLQKSNCQTTVAFVKQKGRKMLNTNKSLKKLLVMILEAPVASITWMIMTHGNN